MGTCTPGGGRAAELWPLDGGNYASVVEGCVTSGQCRTVKTKLPYTLPSHHMGDSVDPFHYIMDIGNLAHAEAEK